MGGFCSQRISFPVWSLNNTCSTSFLSSVTHSHCFLMSFLKSIQIKESPKHKDKHTLKQVAPSSPGTLSLPDIFHFYPCQKILAAAEMKVRRLKMRRHVWTHILVWAPAGSVYGEASHVLFRVGSALALDQSLIERSCDWLLLSIRSGMKEDPWPPHRSGSILAYIESKALESHQPLLSRALVVSRWAI